jgi:lipopolysaccharide/colanic/teichoic acid biosynthesis glycosyltransferase
MTSVADVGALMGTRPLYEVVKRGIDLLVAGAALAALAPVMIGVGIAIRATSRGPALFRQERVGLAETRFVCFKFRTMSVDNDDRIHREYVERLLTEDQPPDGGADGVYKLTSDPRVTPIGRVLRRTSLDELPQLVNVLRGEMSLVGPRPSLPWEVELFESRHRRRAEVKPGITGLWQVSGRSRVGVRQALDLDVEYVRRRSLRLDVEILLRTVVVVLRGSEAA